MGLDLGLVEQVKARHPGERERNFECQNRGQIQNVAGTS